MVVGVLQKYREEEREEVVMEEGQDVDEEDLEEKDDKGEKEKE